MQLAHPTVTHNEHTANKHCRASTPTSPHTRACGVQRRQLPLSRQSPRHPATSTLRTAQKGGFVLGPQPPCTHHSTVKYAASSPAVQPQTQPSSQSSSCKAVDTFLLFLHLPNKLSSPVLTFQRHGSFSSYSAKPRMAAMAVIAAASSSVGTKDTRPAAPGEGPAGLEELGAPVVGQVGAQGCASVAATHLPEQSLRGGRRRSGTGGYEAGRRGNAVDRCGVRGCL